MIGGGQSAPPVDIRKLAFPVEPKPDEGLAELLVRATAENCFRGTSLVPRLAGLPELKLVGIATKARGFEGVIAQTLGIPGRAAEIAALVHAPIGDTRTEGYFGTALRQKHREVAYRRVSPRALKISLHLRAAWALRPFKFDLETRELLLDRCPECRKRFGWHRTAGVQYCDRCIAKDDDGFTYGKVDLRDYPQPVLDVGDEEGLAFVTGLIDPDTRVRARFSPTLHDGLRSFTRGQLFEFCVALCCAITAKPAIRKNSHLDGLRGPEDYARLTPDVLARAGRVVLGWPGSFRDLMDEIHQGRNARAGTFGIWKSFGPLLAIRSYLAVEEGLRELLRAELYSHSYREKTFYRKPDGPQREGRLTISEACVSVGASLKGVRGIVEDPRFPTMRAPGAIKGPVLVDPAMLKDALSAKKEVVRLEAAAKILGVASIALRSLRHDSTAIVEPAPPGRTAGEYCKLAALLGLRRTVFGACTIGPVPEDAANLRDVAALDVHWLTNPWPELLAAIIDGQIEAWKDDRDGPLTERVFVRITGQDSERVSRTWGEGDSRLSTHDVKCMLAVAQGFPAALADIGLLGHLPTLSELLHFRQTHVLNKELRFVLWNICKFTDFHAPRGMLDAFEIEPVARVRVGAANSPIWSRKSVHDLVSDLQWFKETRQHRLPVEQGRITSWRRN